MGFSIHYTVRPIDERKSTLNSYLATTAISQIWDFKEDALILGPWCILDKKNKEIFNKYAFSMAETPWTSARDVKVGGDYVLGIFEELLPIVTQYLNEIHAKDYPIRYWRILTEQWLLNYIEVFYERYQRLELAFLNNKDVWTNVVPIEQCSLITHNSAEFLRRTFSDDFFNLKVFSILAQEFFPDHCQETLEDLNSYEVKVQEPVYFKSRIKESIENLVFRSDEASIIFSDMYRMSFQQKRNLHSSLGKDIAAFYNFSQKNSLNSGDQVQKSRKPIANIQGSDRFCSLLIKWLPLSVPECFVEDFDRYESGSKKNKCVGKVKIVASSVGWFTNEEFKYFAAECVLNGARTIALQHGGNVGANLSLPIENNLLEKDKYFTWGWSKSESSTQPLSSPYLYELANSYKGTDSHIVFVGTLVPRYPFRLHTVNFPENTESYFQDKIDFLDSVSPDVLKQVVYRAYVEDYGWGEVDRIKEKFPNMNFVNTGSLTDGFKQARLIVIDHAHTSFLEALTINAPCILYWNHDVYQMRSEAEPYFQMLRDVGVLFKDAKSAADQVNRVIDNPLEWWSSQSIQDARNTFCSQFCLQSSDWLESWNVCFKELLADEPMKDDSSEVFLEGQCL